MKKELENIVNRLSIRGGYSTDEAIEDIKELFDKQNINIQVNYNKLEVELLALRPHFELRGKLIDKCESEIENLKIKLDDLQKDNIHLKEINESQAVRLNMCLESNIDDLNEKLIDSEKENTKLHDFINLVINSYKLINNNNPAEIVLRMIQNNAADIINKPKESVNKDNIIPPMTHPYGKHWEQPELSEVVICDNYATMNGAAFKKLHNYSRSIPSGVYEGKMWKTTDDRVTWHLHWWSESDEPDKCKGNVREIKIIE